MEERIYHGELSPSLIGQALVAEFNQGNMNAQLAGDDHISIAQIGTPAYSRSGGHTALTVYIEKVDDGLKIRLGQQDWISVAASLGQTAILALLNPFNIINRLDDLAQDYESIQLEERVWAIIDEVARSAGATFELSKRLQRIECSYCGTANPVGEPTCIACGAPLGKEQPTTCPNCGFVPRPQDKFCTNCGYKLIT